MTSYRLLLAVAIVACSLAGVQPLLLRAAPPPLSQTVQKQFAMSGRARLTIHNGRGDVTITTWPRTAIDLKAVKTADAEEEFSAVAIDVKATSDSLELSSRAPASGRLPRTRVDYQLRVPADADLGRIETGRGRIDISGITGRAIVHVENGPLRISDFSGTLDAMTINGDIDAVLARVGPDDSIKLETFNGDIRLRLPRTPAPHFEVRTLNGAVTSEPPLKIEDPFGPRVAHDPGAAGAPFISLVSITGDIHITRR